MQRGDFRLYFLLPVFFRSIKYGHNVKMSLQHKQAAPAIQFSQVNKSFGRGQKQKQIIHNFSLTVKQAETVGFIGPNGAGKSTLIKLLLQFHKPDSGSISTFGTPIQNCEFRHKIGYLSEVPFFYEYLTGHEALFFAGRLQGMDPKSITIRSEELLTRMDLTEAKHEQIKNFSKGMKQRLGFAAAMIHDPPLYIFDEPMSGLDPLGRELVKTLFHDIAAQNKTIFFSSHILSDIEQLCNRIALIHHGHLLYEGTVTDFTQSRNSLEKTFVDEISKWEENV